MSRAKGTRIDLTSSLEDGAVARLVQRRRSIKSYRSVPVDVAQLTRLLSTTVGHGASRPYGSAHARYDIVVTVVAGAVDGLASGVYRYLPVEHALVSVESGDYRARLARATLDANWLAGCPVVLLLSADFGAANTAFVTQMSGRGERFCWFEAGLIAQNVYLWVTENALGTVFLGGIDSVQAQAVTQRLIPQGHTVLGLLPVGYPNDRSVSDTPGAQ
ncbi:SagB-type dehydrogenase family enzyme [Tamaricihabitans halophyticus]|uniref:SagB-type dehydrogenase family enzyme n=1 Tax=Tamaricihabitans halophyticus TaxID=1262583 RepID=A0A4R2Q2Q9_9PSEU|nr:SagB/ThcOx family dehydrogenase [Tamaricihabitans halophyticus]TCP42064.1 SagB-type dehydrogenase family enzyme [Tamaricihabitans halophyticus]